MNNKFTTATYLFILAIVISVIVGFVAIYSKGKSPSFSGTTSQSGSLAIEDYVPVVRYNAGLYTGLPVQASSTLDVTGVATFYGTSTCRAITNGNICYENKGNVDVAYAQVSLTSTSSVPGIIPNPFGTATSTVQQSICDITAPGDIGTAAQRVDISTTSGTLGYGSSTPAFIANYFVPAGRKVMVSWFPHLVSSTTLGSQYANDMFTDTVNDIGATHSLPFIIGPSEYLTCRIATSTAGTFSAYYTGTFSGIFTKP